LLEIELGPDHSSEDEAVVAVTTGVPYYFMLSLPVSFFFG
jgi:hypothetical protein